MKDSTDGKSIKLNMILNAIKGISSVIFPLITFPYITTVLGVENVGKYNFSCSVISYFVLIAGLGIATYATREGARIRDDSVQLNLLANQVFSINIISTIFAYVVFFILLVCVPKFRQYNVLLIILSIQIVFKTIGIEWLYTIYEEFAYITFRSVMFQVVSLVLLFVFVKSEDDLYVYGAITVISSVGSNLLNFIHSKKYCTVRIVKKLDFKKHIRPVMVLFAISAMVTIYVSADTTMLGFMCDDYTVGIYSVSTKIYGVVKTVLASVLIVSVPRLAAILGKKDMDEFNKVASEVYSTLISIVVPSIVGIVVLRKEIVLLLSGREYINSISSLAILAFALLTCFGAYFWGQCILIPIKKDKDIFVATILSASINILLNFILIPIYKEKAAAFTTFLAEGVSYFWCWLKGKDSVKLNGIIKTFIKSLIGSVSIIFVYWLVIQLSCKNTMRLFLTVLFSVVIYIIIECLVNNSIVVNMIKNAKRRLGV